jgi:hypothetical protein
MDERLTDSDRRRLLALVGSGLATSLAGCSGGGGGDGGDDTATPTATPTATETAAPTSTPGDDTVPEEYRTATSLSGAQRNPDSLSSKEALSYQPEPSDGQQCSTCQFYIPDKNGDGMGACTLVAGNIAPEAYCVSYAEYEG